MQLNSWCTCRKLKPDYLEVLKINLIVNNELALKNIVNSLKSALLNLLQGIYPYLSFFPYSTPPQEQFTTAFQFLQLWKNTCRKPDCLDFLKLTKLLIKELVLKSIVDTEKSALLNLFHEIPTSPHSEPPQEQFKNESCLLRFCKSKCITQ